MDNHRKDRNPPLFFMLTFLFSWGIWLPSILVGLGIELSIDAPTYTSITVIIGAFAPLFAAFTLVVKQHGWKEGWNFIRQAFDFKVKPIYLIFSLIIPIIIHATVHYIAPLLGFEVADTLFPKGLPVSPIIISIPYFFLMLLIGGGQEEFGWRGYALAPLQKRLGVIPASILIGLMWGLWHWPLWVMPGDGHSTYPFLAFIIMTTSISVVYSWLYNASNQKLIAVIIFHAMSNTAAPLLPFLLLKDGKPESAYWVYAGVNVIAALIAGIYIQRTQQSDAYESSAMS
jgi:membrane protease YdiL (CAAX protease family)